MKKNGFVIVILSCCLIFAVSSCYYDKADQVYPQPATCDTTNIRLSGELNDIMAANCYSCHNTANAGLSGGGYNLQDFATIHGAALDGRLLSSITQDNKLSPPMPQGGGKLSDCEISKFSAWINAGAPNN